jgi:hypothetical protein
MNKQEFVIFTALVTQLKELGMNFTQFLSEDEVKQYTEIGKNYLPMNNDEFRDELKKIIQEMAGRLLK